MMQRPRGTRDFFPEQMLKRRWLEAKLRSIAQNWGYSEVATPCFEHLELFQAKSGEQLLESIYRFRDKTGRELVLRPELSAPVTRMYCSVIKSLPKPVKVFYFGNCFRYEEPQHARYREFWQFGVEILGCDSVHAQFEVIALAMEMISQLGIQAELRIGNLDLVRKLTQHLDPQARSQVMLMLDRARKVDPKLCPQLAEILNAPQELKLQLASQHLDLTQFQQLLKMLDRHGISYRLDLGVVRGLDYYRGMVFEIHAPSLGAQSQICGGGNYELGSVLGQILIPATGFAFGFDRLVEACSIQLQQPRPIVICPVDESCREMAVQIALQLRKKFPIQLDLMGRNLSEQLSYASSIWAKYALILGRKELESRSLTVRDLDTGNQRMLSLEECIQLLESSLAGSRSA